MWVVTLDFLDDMPFVDDFSRTSQIVVAFSHYEVRGLRVHQVVTLIILRFQRLFLVLNLQRRHVPSFPQETQVFPSTHPRRSE